MRRERGRMEMRWLGEGRAAQFPEQDETDTAEG